MRAVRLVELLPDLAVLRDALEFSCDLHKWAASDPRNAAYVMDLAERGEAAARLTSDPRCRVVLLEPLGCPPPPRAR